MADADLDAELALFRAEIADIDSTAAAALQPVDDDKAEDGGADAAVYADVDMHAAPSSPPHDEREFVDDDGTKYVWDAGLRKFVPVVEAAAAPQYTEEEMTYIGDDAPLPSIEEARRLEEESLARAEALLVGNSNGDAKQDAAVASDAAVEAGADESGGGKRKRRKVEKEKAKDKEKPKPTEQDEKERNTSVYVTGLPLDATIEEIAKVFSKCGIVRLDDEHRPKVKLYIDKATGRPKGDGLVTFLKRPSVELACMLLDDTPLRPNISQTMKVQVAQFNNKSSSAPPSNAKPKEVAAAAPAEAAEAADGDKGDAAQPLEGKSIGGKKKKKKAQNIQDRLLGWGGFDDKLKAEEVTVVLKNMFTVEEMVEQPLLSEELEADVTQECAKLGRVDRCRVFKANPEGVVQVRFNDPDAATKCIEVMNGRFFAGRKVEAFLWDGFTNYNVKVKESEEEQAARLERFAAELEAS